MMVLPNGDCPRCDADALPLPAFYLGAGGRTLLSGNAACGRAYGYRPEDLAGMPTDALFHRPEDHARLLERVAHLRGPEEGVDLVLRTRQGDPAPGRSWLVRAEDGRIVLVVADRRDQVAAQRKIDELSGQLIAIERRADQVANGTLTHALSQPLMAAMGNIELLLLSGDAPADIAPRLERAYEQLDRVRQILTGTSRGPA